MLFTCEEKNLSLNLSVKVMDEVKKRRPICKEFSIKKWAVSFVKDQCRMQKTNLIEGKTGAE